MTAIGAVLSLTRAPKGAQRSCPAGFIADAGLRWCGATPPSTERRISMSKSAKKSSPASTVPVIAAKPSLPAPDDTNSKKADPGSKQSRVIAMLQSPTGATIAAMMKATGWQQHSVRGFLAGVVRKRLKLKLGSKKVDGNRVYRIAGATAVRRGLARQGRRPESHAARQDRSCAAGPERHSMSRLRACVISTSVSFGLVGTPSFGRQPPPHLPVIFCIAFWRTGCRPNISVTLIVRVSGCLIALGLPRKPGVAPWT